MPCSCASEIYEKSLNRLLNLSMIPRACQECQLNSTGCTRAESIEWVLQLNETLPIWSRLIDINTSGYRRKLPMAMTKNYHIEIDGRLWSLWGHKRKHKMPKIFKKANNGYHMAATVMALCCARVIRLNIWNSLLMDSIYHNARKYLKESLEKYKFLKKTNLRLEHLSPKCQLEGISFKVCLKTVLRGRLYSVPLECQPNLAFALKQFFDNYQYGLLECCHRILGFGFIDGPSGGYFMYDAQSINKPLFSTGYHAPYLLRTNHLQVLLYCLIVALNIPFMHANFCLHHLNIKVIEMELPKDKTDSQSPFPPCEHILPTKYWHVPSLYSLQTPSSQINPFAELQKCKELLMDEVEQKQKPAAKRKYRRKPHNISKWDQEKGIIKPLVDHDDWPEEGMELKNDFVRMVCSDTVVQKMTDDEIEKNDFARSLTEAMFMGSKCCIKLGKDFSLDK